MLSAKEARLRVRKFESSHTAQTLRDIELAIIRAANRGLAKILHPTYVAPDYSQIISILKEQGYTVSLELQPAFTTDDIRLQLAIIRVAW